MMRYSYQYAHGGWGGGSVRLAATDRLGGGIGCDVARA